MGTGSEKSSSRPDVIEGHSVRRLFESMAGKVEPVDADVELGELGQYELLEEIARGGMGIVFKARQRGVGRLAAVKVLRSGGFAAESELQRFQAEAEALGRLDHPNIVPVFEVGEEGGRHFLAMKFIEGGNLEEGVERFVRNPRKAAEVVAKAGRAVAVAHTRGILHRDLKPANVLLDTVGEPHLTDFGLARSIGQDSGLTVTGAVLGSPNYIAPEQVARGASDVTTAVDVYGLGAILYHLLTGRPPHEGESVVAVLRQVAEEEPGRPSLLNARVDRDLETICLKCLRREPGERYGSALAVAEDLERWLAGEPISARPPGAWRQARVWVKRHPVWAATVVAALVGMVAFFVQLKIYEGELEAEQVLTLEANAELREVVRRLKFERAQRWFEGGNPAAGVSQLAAILREEPGNRAASGRLSFELENLAFGIPDGGVIKQGGGVVDLAMSPDGRRMMAQSFPNAVLLWDVEAEEALTGEAAQAWSRAGGVRAMEFSGDGQWAMVGWGGGVLGVWGAEDGEAVMEVDVGDDGLVMAGFCGEGRVFALTSRGKVRVWSVAGGEAVDSLALRAGLVTAVAKSTGGGRVAVGYADGTVEMLTVGGGLRVERVVERTDVGVRSLVFAGEGGSEALVAVAGAKGLRRYEPVVGGGWRVVVEEEATSALSGAKVRMAGGARGEWFALLQSGNEVVVYDSVTLRPTGAPRDLNTGVNAMVALETRGEGGRVREVLAVGAMDGFVRFFDPVMPMRDVLAPLYHGVGATGIGSVVEGGVATRLAVGTNGSGVVFWRLPGERRVKRADLGEPSGPKPVAGCFFGDGEVVVGAARGRGVFRWEPATGEHEVWQPKLDAHAKAVVRGPGGTRFLVLTSGPELGGAKVWDAASEGKEGHRLEVPGGISDGVFCGDGGLVAVVGGDSEGRLFEAATGELMDTFACVRGRREQVIGAAPDGGMLAVVATRGVVKVYRVTGGGLEERAALKHGDQAAVVAFSRSGGLLATGSFGGVVRLWDAESGERVRTLTGHRGPISRLAFGETGGREALYSGSRDGTVRSWDVASGEPRETVLEQGAPVTKLEVSGDGMSLATAGTGNRVRVWDAVSGFPLTQALEHGSMVSGVAFAESGEGLLTSSAADGLRFWSLPLARPLRDERVVALAEAATTIATDVTGAQRRIGSGVFTELRDEVLGGELEGGELGWAKEIFGR